MWTEQEARDRFAEVLQRAQTGEAQVVGDTRPCVVISLNEYDRLRGKNEPAPFGRWLVENAPRVGDLELPPRERERPVPFADDLDDDEPAK